MSFSGKLKFKRLCIPAAVLIYVLIFTGSAMGLQYVKIATYNLENLFDMSRDGTEYPGYVPGGPLGWDHEMMETKLVNLSRVIHDLSADIIGLQEVESQKALKQLRRHLGRRGTDYPHFVIADARPATVRCALLSKYPVVHALEIPVAGGADRSILRADLDISGHRLVVFVNHWKSKSGPESRRKACARALAEAVANLPEKTDYVLLGDFNTNYNEHETIGNRRKLNNTDGKTGLQHVLKTLTRSRPVKERDLAPPAGQGLHYNLWLELPEDRRWSAMFFGRPQSPDAILVPAALYDERGISYVDNSFDRFDPGYLFDRERIKRWQRTRKGRGRHLGKGYSDHLPVYACFNIGPFVFRQESFARNRRPEQAEIADLYAAKTGAVRFRLSNCAVIYRHRDNAVIKQANGRAIYVYKVAHGLSQGRVYDLTVNRLKRYYGNLEITGLEDVGQTGRIRSKDGWYITDPDTDFSDPALENEVIGKVSGRYARNRFYYGNQRRIRLYFQNKDIAPKQPARIEIQGARIGYHHGPELVIEKPAQIKGIDP